MKIAGMILAVLMLLGSAAIGAIGANKTMDLVEIMDEVPAEVREAAGLPSAGRLKIGGIVAFLAAAGAMALLVTTFVKKDKIPMLIGIAVGLCVIAIVANPSIEVGPADGMAPRTQAMVAAVMAALGAAGSFLVSKSKKKQQSGAPAGNQIPA